MKVFAVIVTYNGMVWYDRCFKSLQQSEMPVQIIVVDNDSSDGTIDFIPKNYPEITFIESKANLGFAKANNIGIRYALDNKADYVFLLNQDAWLNQTNTISELIKQAELNQDCAIISPLQLYGSGERIEKEVVIRFSRIVDANDDFISDVYFNRIKDIYRVPYACAVSWLLPIKTIKEIGGFDPLFYHYGEDDNYLQRVIYMGYNIGICPKVSISHDIEHRAKEYRDENLDWRKYLLIHYANVNVPVDIKKILSNKLRVILIQFLRFNKKILKQSLPEYLYLKEIQNALTESRKNNMERKTNWL